MKVPMRKTALKTINLQDMVDKAMDLEEQETRGYLGASQVGIECERALWYSFRWCTPINFIARIRRRFETGFTYEDRVVAWLRKAGFEVRDKNPLATNERKQYRADWLGGAFAGGTDGFVRGGPLGPVWHLLEIKAMASSKYLRDDDGEPIANKTTGTIEGRWWNTHRRGMVSTQQEHHAQVQAYMGFSREPGVLEKWGLDEPLPAALYVAVNTDTEQIHDEVVEYKPVWWDRIKGRVIRVLRLTTPPARIYEDPEAFTCRYCDHRDICHGTTPVQQTCRSCRHSRLKLPGDANYYAPRATWLCDYLKADCGDQLGCPHWEQYLTPTERF